MEPKINNNPECIWHARMWTQAAALDHEKWRRMMDTWMQVNNPEKTDGRASNKEGHGGLEPIQVGRTADSRR